MGGSVTKNFSYEEFGQDLTELDRYKIHQLCKTILQPVRDVFGVVTINSGKRSAAHNQKIGGSPTSHHLYNGLSCAVDFTTFAYCGDVQGRADVALFILQRCPFAFSEFIWYTTTNHFHMALPTPRHGQKVLVKTNQPSPNKYINIEFDPTNATASARRVVSKILEIDEKYRV